jgi:hypothetical protein
MSLSDREVAAFGTTAPQSAGLQLPVSAMSGRYSVTPSDMQWAGGVAGNTTLPLPPMERPKEQRPTQAAVHLALTFHHLKHPETSGLQAFSPLEVESSTRLTGQWPATCVISA